jgi:hypothetical protein
MAGMLGAPFSCDIALLPQPRGFEGLEIVVEYLL